MLWKDKLKYSNYKNRKNKTKTNFMKMFLSNKQKITKK